MDEIWKDIPGYEGYYQASNFGNIKSVDRIIKHTRCKKMHRNETILKQHRSIRNGYMHVSLCVGNIAKTKRVHRLILSAFKPTNNKKMQCNHIDGDKTNNNINNLEWVTQSENMKHAYETCLEVPTWNRRVIRLNDLKIYDSLTDAAIDNGGKKPTSILRVCNGYRSQYKGNRFAYYEDYLNNTIPKYRGKYEKKPWKGDKI
jgi:hypothetical protein